MIEGKVGAIGKPGEIIVIKTPQGLSRSERVIRLWGTVIGFGVIQTIYTYAIAYCARDSFHGQADGGAIFGLSVACSILTAITIIFIQDGIAKVNNI